MSNGASPAAAKPASLDRLSTTFADLLISGAAARPDRTAILFPHSRLSYGELLDRSWALAKSLAVVGVGPGDRVGILMVNSPEQVVAMFACSILGGIFVPINARYKSDEIGFLVADAGVRAIVTHARHADYVDFAELLCEAIPALATASDPRQLELPDLPELRSVLLVGGDHPGLVGEAGFAALANDADEDRIALWCSTTSLRSTAAIIYTSGTTARPRGAMLSHEALVGHWSMFGRRWGMRESDIFWVPVPLFHIAAIGPLIAIMAHGGTFLSDSHFDAGRALDEIERHGATLLYPTYPPLTESLIAHGDFARRDLSSVRMWLNVAPPEVLRRMAASFPDAIMLTTYGSTEGGPVTLSDPDESFETRMTTCGRPMHGTEVRVIGQDGADVPTGEAGEIIYRGYNCFSGYYGDPEKTSATIREGGWIHTGDLGCFDGDGRLQYLGRSKEMLKVGGENVAPAEVEELLASHPAVKLVQVVGVPDAKLVEVVAAAVELHEGTAASEDELIAFCKGRIASFKVPRFVRFVTEWPMSATKIQRNELRQQMLARLGIEE